MIDDTLAFASVMAAVISSLGNFGKLIACKSLKRMVKFVNLALYQFDSIT
jgi:hypothetical protein